VRVLSHLTSVQIRDNICLGDPPHASDLSKIRQAAELGGASTFIESLAEQYDTYLDRPVQDYYSSIPEGATNLFGRPVDYRHIRKAMYTTLHETDGSGVSGNRGLSGGQMQRIALWVSFSSSNVLGPDPINQLLYRSRTFMRSVVSDDSVGLLLFDEPSASLDPSAEHDLFERLRKLRGSKTMIFSSHRFGNLTRHADLIL